MVEIKYSCKHAKQPLRLPGEAPATGYLGKNAANPALGGCRGYFTADLPGWRSYEAALDFAGWYFGAASGSRRGLVGTHAEQGKGWQ